MRKILPIAFLGLTNFLLAQPESHEFTNIGRVNLGLHGLEVSYELPIARKFVWENNFGIGMGSSVRGNSVEFVLSFPTLYIKSELKFIYNTRKRILKEKITLNNSGNYIGLQSKFNFGKSSYRDLNQSLLTEIHWGVQRSLDERWILNVHVGLGYLRDFDTFNGAMSPTLGLRFGYKLF